MEVSKIKTIVFDLHSSVFIVPVRSAFELKNENQIMSQDYGVNPFSTPWNRILEEKSPRACRGDIAYRTQDPDLITPGAQLLGCQFRGRIGCYAGLTTDDKIGVVSKELPYRCYI